MIVSSEARLRDGALEDLSEVLKEIGALLVQSGEIRADGAESFEAVHGTKAAGDFLFDLGHAHGLLGDVVGEGNVMIDSKAPDIVGMGTQAVDQIERLALPSASALAGRRESRIDGLSLGENRVIVFSIGR